MFEIELLLVVLSYAACIGAVQLKDRKNLLLGFALSALLFAWYLATQEAYSGAFICLVTCVSNFVQAFIPCSKEQQCLKIRLFVGLGVAALGTSLLFQSGSDLFPILAFISGRFCEAQSTSQRIRLWILPQHAAWMAYGMSHSMTLVVIGELLWALSTFRAVMQEFHQRKKALARVKA